MDEQTRFNRERWTALSKAGVDYAQPRLEETPASALYNLDPDGRLAQIGLTDLTGKDVLCLASGGGQQSARFGVLGANVTVLDFTPHQLELDQKVADHYGFDLRLVEGDMRDLSLFEAASFDIVWHPFSVNFIPDPLPVYREVARVIRPKGLYYHQFANPHWTMDEHDWTGNGYPIKQPYVQGSVLQGDSMWEVNDQKIEGPTEFMHTFGTIVNGLGENGFHIYAITEMPHGKPDDEPGTWYHIMTYLPLWPAFWTIKT